MAMHDPAQPIIVKKIKKGGHAHHGGAWKVAFADFVTAMMAFFLLLWLLGNTTDEQRRGISDYFNDPTIVENTSGASNAAIDMGGGMNIPSGAGENPDELFQAQGEVFDAGKQSFDDEPSEAELAEQAAEADRLRLEQLKDELEAAIAASEQLAQFKDQILLDITSEGLRVQIVDKENRPMFDLGSSRLKDYTRDILREVVQVIDAVPNRISISGHTDQTPFAATRDGYSNWELSADRANAARREFVAAGLPEDKLGRIVGLASSVLYDKSDPFSPANRRISIIVMNREAEAELNGEGGPVSADVPAAGGSGAPDPAAAAVPEPAGTVTPGQPAPAPKPLAAH
ncbi:MAG: flagellar motor protein MotB [Gammaproteobacteria bacterium]|nr:flagellar motor protein MotB [Gammaproteobacteria bacterium]